MQAPLAGQRPDKAARARSNVSDPADHVVLELPRGEADMLRVTRRSYQGKPFTDVRIFFRGDDGELHPTKKGATIRDYELGQVIEALRKIERAQSQPRRPAPRGPAPTGDLTKADESERMGVF